MLATFSNFLPASLSLSILKEEREKERHSDLKSESATTPKLSDPPQDTVQAFQGDAMRDVAGAKKKKEKGVNETFIVVRPPPSVSNHPLNLQLQLVPPHARDRTSSTRQSVDYGSNPLEGIPQTPTQQGSPLQRTTSGRSNRSDVSMYSSVSSASLASISTQGSGRRMIIPLYNLCAHNVMMNTIVDAGTDAKVVKFTKRGMEVIGLAVLEPMEVWIGADEMRRKSSLTSMSARRSSLLVPHDFAHTPESSVLSLSSTGETSIAPSPMPPIPETPSTPTGAKKLFGKIFKKKDVSVRSFAPSPSVSPATPRVSAISNLSIPASPSHLRTSAENAVLQPPVLGIQTTLVSPHNPPIGRPNKYVWVITKWLKGTADYSLSGMMGRLNVDRNSPREPGSEVDVRVEWTRVRKRPAGPKRASIANSGTAASSTQSSPSGGNKRASLVSESGRNRSNDSHRSRSPRGGETTSESASDEHGPNGARRPHGPEDEDDDESDPEAYETPWTCNLMITPRNQGGGIARTHSQHSSAGHGIDSPITVTKATPDLTPLSPNTAHTPIRFKIASLSPAPYHPKVVAQLKVPFPLPDIEIDRVEVRRRTVTSAGVARPAFDGSKPVGLILTAEEIKDILSSTALWLVVREGFGGVGKVNRKGDGWRIRA